MLLPSSKDNYNVGHKPGKEERPALFSATGDVLLFTLFGVSPFYNGSGTEETVFSQDQS